MLLTQTNQTSFVCLRTPATQLRRQQVVGKGGKGESEQRQWKWRNWEITCPRVQPRLETQPGCRVIFLGHQLWHFHLGFCFHLLKQVKECGIPTQQVAKDLQVAMWLSSPAPRAQEQWEVKLVGYQRILKSNLFRTFQFEGIYIYIFNFF